MRGDSAATLDLALGARDGQLNASIGLQACRQLGRGLVAATLHHGFSRSTPCGDELCLDAA